MNAKHLDITEASDACAVVWLCTFGETVTTPAGRVTPEQDGFRLDVHGARRARTFPTALPAVRGLRKAARAAARVIHSPLSTV